MKNTYPKLKIMTIIGTRPEIIKLSRIIPFMDKHFDHIVVFTSQSYSYELSDVFFKELGLRKPNYILNVKAETVGQQIANVLSQTERIMISQKPDAIFILGDTNSSLSSIVAKRIKIPIFHYEAGNRSFDWDVPEEINRRIVDHISNFNLAYTEHARRNLINEGIPIDKIFVIGSPLAEVLQYYRKNILDSKILNELKLKREKYFVVSTHREENVDNKYRLEQLFKSFNDIAKVYSIPIIVTLHPRTKNKLNAIANARINPLVKFFKPFGFFDYVKLQQNACCVLSDSGTIQEESAMLKFRAIQIRVSTERPEAFDTGSIIVTGIHVSSILNALDLVISKENDPNNLGIPQNYQDKNVSLKIVKLIMGFASIRKCEI